MNTVLHDPIEIPSDIVNSIFNWVSLFHQSDAMDRIHGFRGEYNQQWTAIMGDIRTNVPRYTASVMTMSGAELNVSIFSPDCNPIDWRQRSLGSSFLGMIRRRALSLRRNLAS